MKRQTTIVAISVIASLVLTKNIYATQGKELLPPASPFSFQNQITKDIKSPLVKVAYNPAMEVKPTLNLNQPIPQTVGTAKPNKNLNHNNSKVVIFRGKKISAALAALYDSPLN